MRQFLALTTLLGLFITVSSFGQAKSQTFFSTGANILNSKDFRTYYDEECTPPTFFCLGVMHSWYRTDKVFTLNKEIGVNTQYSSPSLSSGGLGAHSYSKYQMLHLFAEATVQAQIKIDSDMSVAIGPAIEYLITGYNHTNTSYSYFFNNQYLSGETNHSGFNRDYFGDPIWGIKFSVFNFGMSDKATFKINCGYFRLKQDGSNFHSSSFIKVGVAVGFAGKKTTTK